MTPAVAVVDDHGLFADTLCAALALDGVAAAPVPVVGGLGSLVGRVLDTGARVALVDVVLHGGRSGVDLVGPLTVAGVHVVVVSGLLGGGADERARDAGAVAVLDKGGSLADLRAVVARHVGLARPDWPLSAREADVLGQLMAGRTAAQVAEDRGVAVSTVRTQIRSVLVKLGVRSQLAAVAAARDAGWRPPD